MQFFTKKLWISKHCISRFDERVGDKEGNPIELTKTDIRKRILSDFEVRNVRYKSPKEENGDFFLFAKSARLYACQEKEKVIIVKTVIQQTQEKAKEFREKYLQKD